MRLIESYSRIPYHLEAIDIENEEYVFWDANGAGVSVAVTPTTAFKTGKLESVKLCSPVFPIQDALKEYAKSLGLPEVVAEGPPMEAWGRIQKELAGRPKKRSFLSRLFSGKDEVGTH